MRLSLTAWDVKIAKGRQDNSNLTKEEVLWLLRLYQESAQNLDSTN